MWLILGSSCLVVWLVPFLGFKCDLHSAHAWCGFLGMLCFVPDVWKGRDMVLLMQVSTWYSVGVCECVCESETQLQSWVNKYITLHLRALSWSLLQDADGTLLSICDHYWYFWCVWHGWLQSVLIGGDSACWFDGKSLTNWISDSLSQRQQPYDTSAREKLNFTVLSSVFWHI